MPEGVCRMGVRSRRFCRRIFCRRWFLSRGVIVPHEAVTQANCRAKHFGLGRGETTTYQVRLVNEFI